MRNHLSYFYIQYSELINLFNSNIEIINIIYITLPNFPKQQTQKELEEYQQINNNNTETIEKEGNKI